MPLYPPSLRTEVVFEKAPYLESVKDKTPIYSITKNKNVKDETEDGIAVHENIDSKNV